MQNRYFEYIKDTFQITRNVSKYITNGNGMYSMLTACCKYIHSMTILQKTMEQNNLFIRCSLQINSRLTLSSTGWIQKHSQEMEEYCLFSSRVVTKKILSPCIQRLSNLWPSHQSTIHYIENVNQGPPKHAMKTDAWVC